MRIVLCHLANPHQAVEGTIGFIAVATAKFSHPDRQIAIATLIGLENLNVRWTVHRLERQ